MGDELPPLDRRFARKMRRIRRRNETAYGRATHWLVYLAFLVALLAWLTL